MTSLVLDCSVAMAWCFEDECDEYADDVLAALERSQAKVPCIWPLEVANVLLVAERQRRLKTADASRFLELVGTLPIEVEHGFHPGLLPEILSLGRDLGISAYDASYLALAMRHGHPLATRDRRMRRACRKAGVDLFSRTDFTPPGAGPGG